MKKIHIRRAKLSDVPSIIEVEKKAWPNGLAATREMFFSRIRTFPDGVNVAEHGGTIVGVSVTEIINYDRKKTITWNEITDKGLIAKTHTMKGNAVFGVDLSVVPEVQNRGVATKLLEEIGKYAIKRNIPIALLGGRIPGYHKFSNELSAEDYVKKTTTDGEPFDPEVRFYKNAGLKIEMIIPDYFSDEESNNYGILLVWKNPFYIKNKILGKISGNIFKYLFKVK